MRDEKPGLEGIEAIAYRSNKLKSLTDETGVYALCDLDHVPIYVGKSTDGIRSRVRRHLTSARSDVVANRQVDVWEIASVKAWPISGGDNITSLEANIFHHYNDKSPLMNGSVPKTENQSFVLPNPSQSIMLMPEDEVLRRRQADIRLPRQISHYLNLVDHYLNIKNSKELRAALDVHFNRMKRYHKRFLE